MLGYRRVGLPSLPARGSRLIRGHPLTRGLLFCAPFWEGTGWPRELIVGRPIVSDVTTTYAAAWQGTPGGLSWGGGNVFYAYDPAPRVPPGYPFTMHVRLFQATASGSRGIFMLLTPGGAQTGLGVSPDAGGGLATYYRMYDSEATTDPVFAGRMNNLTLVCEGTTSRSVYLNGKLVVTESTSVAFQSFDRTLFFSLAGGINSGYVKLACIWDRGLTANEVLTLWTDPFGMFEPVRHRIGRAGAVAPPAEELVLMGASVL